MNVFLGMVISLKTNMAPENGPWKKEIPFQTSTADSGPHVLDGDPICPALLPRYFRGELGASWGETSEGFLGCNSDVWLTKTTYVYITVYVCVHPAEYMGDVLQNHHSIFLLNSDFPL